MSSSQRRIERVQRRQARREKAKALTRRGLCSRCGRPSTEHPTGVCPDGLGSFTWALGRQDLDRVIDRLERARAESLAHEGEILTRDEQAVLDAVVEFTLGQPEAEGAQQQFAAASFLLAPDDAPRPGLPADELARRTGLPLHHVRALIDRLVAKGYLGRNSSESPS
jgi:hypothetical protein